MDKEQYLLQRIADLNTMVGYEFWQRGDDPVMNGAHCARCDSGWSLTGSVCPECLIDEIARCEDVFDQAFADDPFFKFITDVLKLNQEDQNDDE